jgi:hypothetical protein
VVQRQTLWLQTPIVLCHRYYIFIKVLEIDPILQSEHINAVRTEGFLRYYTGSTADMATYSAGGASWHSPYDWEFALGLLGATGERYHDICESPWVGGDMGFRPRSSTGIM